MTAQVDSEIVTATVAEPIRVQLASPEHSFTIGEVLLEQPDRIGQPARGQVGAREVVVRSEGFRLASPEHPLVVGDVLLA